MGTANREDPDKVITERVMDEARTTSKACCGHFTEAAEHDRRTR
jgi:hypothetical protein